MMADEINYLLHLCFFIPSSIDTTQRKKFQREYRFPASRYFYVAKASPAGCFSVHCSTLEAGRTFWWLLLSTATSAFAAASAMNAASAQNIHPRALRASVAIKWGFPKPYVHATKEIGHFQGISYQKSPLGAAQHPSVGAQTQSSVWVPV